MRAPAARIEGRSDEVLRDIIAGRFRVCLGNIRVDKNVAFKDITTNGRRQA